MPCKRKYTEEELDDAVQAIRCGAYAGSTAASRDTGIPRQTLDTRLKGAMSAHDSHRIQQILTHNEERILVRRITELTRTGFPMTPLLAREVAEKIREERLQLKEGPRVQFAPISKDWVVRFKKRHADIDGVWARPIDLERHNACTIDALKKWANALEETLSKGYQPEDIYNMDETGFNIGESQVNRVLINIKDSHKMEGSARTPGVDHSF